MAFIEGRDPIPALDLTGADKWRLLLTADRVPKALVELPGMNAGPYAELADAALSPYFAAAEAERRLRAELRRRLGAPDPRRADLTTSVVICTRSRPHVLPALLESAARLDPAPEEVIVVDNDPGGKHCRAEADRFGATYVPERRRGLNNARHTGARAAGGDIVALTDDDCLLQPGWLRSLGERFADPMVAAVTGPAFPHELETDLQVLRERAAPYLQSFRVRSLDWTTTSTVRTGQVGFGANMILRRSALAELGELFPPELDAGTATQAGGDLYALHRVLAAGYRVCFDPAAFVLHRHGASGDPVERTVESWGIGFFALLTRLIVRDRELGALPYATLPIRACLAAVLDAAQGTGDPVTLRMRWDYLRNALAGPAAWIQSRAIAYPGRASRGAVPPGRTDDGDRSPAGEGRAITHDTAGGTPALSVVISPSPSSERFPARLRDLARCQALNRSWEVILVSPSAPQDAADVGPEDQVFDEGLSVRSVRAAGGWAERANAGAAAARADVLLFLDEDLDWQPGLLAAHLRRHEETEHDVAVIGYSPSRPANRGLAALAKRLRSEDGLRLTAEAATHTFVDIRPENLSVTRTTLERVGPFDPELPAVRVGWDWGARALKAGLQIVYEQGASAPRVSRVTTERYLEEALEEGRGDAVLASKHPELASSLPRPAGERWGSGSVLQCLAARALRTSGARRLALPVLGVAEAIRLRRGWLWLANAARRGAHERGQTDRAQEGRRRRRRRVHVLDLDSAHVVAPPKVAAPAAVELRVRGRPLTRARPRDGHWHHGFLEQALRDAGRWHAAAASLAPDEARFRLPDLTGTEVIYGPARRAGDTRHSHAFEAAGASVKIVDGHPGISRGPVVGTDHWLALDVALRKPGPEVIGLPLPGVSPEPHWLALASAGLDVEPLAAVIGAGVEDDLPAGPLQLFSRDPRRLPYEHGVRPPQFMVFRRSLYAELGGFQPAAAVAGPLGPVLDFVERALEAGLIVGYRETPGISPDENRGIARLRARWWRAEARGGLLTRRAIATGGARGIGWFASRALLPRVREFGRALTARDRTLLGWTAGMVGFVTGGLRAMAKRTSQPTMVNDE